jgi:SAM-dependent methyltransferase
MGFYQDHIFPVLINLAMRRQELADYRGRVIPSANGRVLEIGIGSGLNLPFYSRDVERLIGLDPSPKLLSMVRRNLRPREMHRVLRPTGRLLFVEHGRAPEPNVRWWQDHLTPAWKRIGGGCHLNRAIQSLIEDAGFQFDRFETGYMRGPKPLAFMYEGTARSR